MGSTPNPLLRQALRYAERGIPVFPVDALKAPLTTNGFKDASTDTKAIQLMFNKAGPKATGIGGYLGGVGMVGFDVDDKPAKGKNGHADLELFEALHGEAIDRNTVTTVTPSGGRHYWYRVNGAPVGAHDGIKYEGRATAIDIKGAGGYIVLPGSEGYAFLPGHDLFDGAPIATVASWVPQYAPAARAGSGEPGAPVDLRASNEWITAHTATTTDRDLAAEITKWCDDLATADSRHPTLKQIIGRLIGQAGNGIAVDLPAAFGQIHAALAANRQGHGEPRPTGKEVADLVAWTVTRQAKKEQALIFDHPEAQAPSGEDYSAPDPEDVPAEPDAPPRPVLAIEGIGAIAARVDATPPPQFIARPVWPADAYGVLAAENKAGKSWAALDLAVSVAAGTAWMGLWPCETPGPVLVFLGEGSERKTVRRLRAVCAFHGVRLEELPIRVCHRAPKLADGLHLGAIAAELAATPAALVIVDPLYLSAGGANGASLYDMGDLLGGVQYLAQAASAALVVVHHWNQTGTGKDRSRMSGAGPAEWGRVLVSVSVDERRTEPDRTSVVTLGWRIVGDELPDTDVKVVRRVRATDPDDLASPMTYRVDPAGITADAPEWDGPKECMAAITAWFTEHPDEELSKRAVAERLRAFGLSYRDRTVGDALERLAVEQVLTVRRGARNARLFGLAREHPLLELEAV